MQNELTAERIEASIEYMEEMYRCCDTQTGNVPKAYATALAALRAEQERQWISVKDRLPDWTKSPGAKFEHGHAEALKKRIILYMGIDTALPRW